MTVREDRVEFYTVNWLDERKVAVKVDGERFATYGRNWWNTRDEAMAALREKGLDPAHHDWQTPTTTYLDATGGERTALVVIPGGKGGSIDIVDGDGERLCEINLFAYTEGRSKRLIVDVIDVDKRYGRKEALIDPGKDRTRLDFDYLVSCDMGRI